MLQILILGFLFGTILQRSQLNKFNTISGMATLKILQLQSHSGNHWGWCNIALC